MQRAQETSCTHIVTLEHTEEWPSTWCRTDWPASSQGHTDVGGTGTELLTLTRAEASMWIPVPHSVLLFHTNLLGPEPETGTTARN